jgi:hypothetical protein
MIILNLVALKHSATFVFSIVNTHFKQMTDVGFGGKEAGIPCNLAPLHTTGIGSETIPFLCKDRLRVW